MTKKEIRPLFDINKLHEDGLEVDGKFRSPENQEDKKARLHREKILFYAILIGTSFAAIYLAIITFFPPWPEANKLALAALINLFTSSVSFLIGRRVG
jgi:hypothetical protein